MCDEVDEDEELFRAVEGVAVNPGGTWVGSSPTSHNPLIFRVSAAASSELICSCGAKRHKDGR